MNSAPRKYATRKCHIDYRSFLVGLQDLKPIFFRKCDSKYVTSKYHINKKSQRDKENFIIIIIILKFIRNEWSLNYFFKAISLDWTIFRAEKYI